jgi:hypothetical protein
MVGTILPTRKMAEEKVCHIECELCPYDWVLSCQWLMKIIYIYIADASVNMDVGLQRQQPLPEPPGFVHGDFVPVRRVFANALTSNLISFHFSCVGEPQRCLFYSE